MTRGGSQLGARERAFLQRLAARRDAGLLGLADDAGITVYHGTDIASARRLLGGEALDKAVAAAGKLDGPPGFFLATDIDDALFFAYRRSPGGLLQYDISACALSQLRKAGLIRQAIPRGAKSPLFLGDELIVPTEAFGLFNRLREASEIVVTPGVVR